MSEKTDLLWKALLSKGYTCKNPFISDIIVKESDDPRYEFVVEVYRWNTRRGWMVTLAAKWNEKQQRYMLTYYKRGKTGSNYQPV